MYDTGINVFCKIIEKALKSTKIILILPFMRDPSTCERERVTRCKGNIVIPIDKITTQSVLGCCNLPCGFRNMSFVRKIL